MIDYLITFEGNDSDKYDGPEDYYYQRGKLIKMNSSDLNLIKLYT